MTHDPRHSMPTTITHESAVLGTGMGLAIVGGGAVLAGAQLGGFTLLAAGLACLGVSLRMPPAS